MLVVGFPAGSWGTNCYVVAPGPGEQCVIIDPGQDATGGVEEIVRKHRLTPVAVLLTHGHIDHVFSVVPVCGAHRVPAYIHPADREMIVDPAKGLGLPVGRSVFGSYTFTEPEDVRELGRQASLTLAGLEFTLDHAPGHTRGSVTFRLPGQDSPGGDVPPLFFTGDLLFAGSIGRTDLPGGDHATILDSLARVCLPLTEETVVLPGHGQTTTIGRERTTNPFLIDVASGARGGPGPTRGL